MVQTKKFENTFVNEYFAWNLHDQDVEKRQKINDAINFLNLGVSVDVVAKGTGLAIDYVKDLLKNIHQ